MRTAAGRRLATVCVIVVAGFTGSATGQWAQWGGPGRNFVASAVELSEDWDEVGPPELWRRPLGDGTSAISVADGTLCTMFRRGDDEVVTAIDPQDGRAIWEYSYAAPTWPLFQAIPSRGPHSTPLIAEGRVFALGIRGRLSALSADEGRLLWSHDLWDEYGVEPRPSGYANSALSWRGLLIVPVGGTGRGVAAFRQDNGEPVWFSQDFRNGYGSPLLIDVDGQEQLVVVHADGVAGLAPADGRLLWSHPHTNAEGINASTPLWCEGNVLFISSAYGGGSRALRLNRSGDSTTIEELWTNRRVQVHFGNALEIDGNVLASSGESGPAFLSALDAATGKLRFRQRGFGKASFLRVGDRILLLDEGGELALATLGDRRLEILAQAPVLNAVARTVPTLVGTTLFIRDREEIAALDLGVP